MRLMGGLRRLACENMSDDCQICSDQVTPHSSGSESRLTMIVTNTTNNMIMQSSDSRSASAYVIWTGTDCIIVNVHFMEASVDPPVQDTKEQISGDNSERGILLLVSSLNNTWYRWYQTVLYTQNKEQSSTTRFDFTNWYECTKKEPLIVSDHWT